MNNMNKLISKQIHGYIKVFMTKTFGEEYENAYRIVAEELHGPFGVICAQEEYFIDLSDIYCALEHNIGFDIFTDRYYERLDYYEKYETNEGFVNLYNYNKVKGKSLHQ